jgi:hypothetical protein
LWRSSYLLAIIQEYLALMARFMDSMTRVPWMDTGEAEALPKRAVTSTRRSKGYAHKRLAFFNAIFHPGFADGYFQSDLGAIFSRIGLESVEPWQTQKHQGFATRAIKATDGNPAASGQRQGAEMAAGNRYFRR